MEKTSGAVQKCKDNPKRSSKNDEGKWWGSIDLKEQKNLLMIEPEHVRHDLNKQEEILSKIKKQKHVIQADIEKFKATRPLSSSR